MEKKRSGSEEERKGRKNGKRMIETEEEKGRRE